MGTGKTKKSCNNFARSKSLTADLALVLTVSTIIIVDVMMRSTAQRTDSIFRDRFTITSLNWFDWFTIFPLIVFKKELPVLFDEGFDDR